eukprot:3168639-Amphidinium_carterae.2
MVQKQGCSFSNDCEARKTPRHSAKASLSINQGSRPTRQANTVYSRFGWYCSSCSCLWGQHVLQTRRNTVHRLLEGSGTAMT